RQSFRRRGFGTQGAQRRQQEVRKPQRSEGKHQRVDPHRQQQDERRQRQRQHTQGPQRGRRRPQVARDHAHGQQGRSVRAQQLLTLLRGGPVGQGVEHQHTVGQPAPDQGRQHHRQRGHQPQRQAQHQGQQRQHRG